MFLRTQYLLGMSFVDRLASNHYLQEFFQFHPSPLIQATQCRFQLEYPYHLLTNHSLVGQCHRQRLFLLQHPIHHSIPKLILLGKVMKDIHYYLWMMSSCQHQNELNYRCYSLNHKHYHSATVTPNYYVH